MTWRATIVSTLALLISVAWLWIPAGVYASRAEALRTYLELMPPLALSMSAGLRSLRGSSR